MNTNKNILLKARQSIAVRWTAAILAIVFIQSILLCAILLFGGVLSQAKENAYTAFSEKTEERKNYLQGEMHSRFTNIDLHADSVSSLLSEGLVGASTKETEGFLVQASPVIISMLRASAATDAFLILNDDTQGSGTHSAIYFRDYDPLVDNRQNSDLRLMLGPTEAARFNGAMTGDSWQYNLVLDKSNEAFYRKPYDSAGLTKEEQLLGYWSEPFRINAAGDMALTYSRPLFDTSGQLRGVIGIGVLTQYLDRFLSASATDGADSLGYILGVKNGQDTAIRPLVSSNVSQQELLEMGNGLEMFDYDGKTGIGKLENGRSQQQIYTCIKKLEMYNSNTPFEEEEWYLVGLMEEDTLLMFTNKISKLLLFSFLLSIPLGTVCGIIISRRFTTPIIALVKQVRESDYSEPLSFEKTGFAEIDELAQSIEVANEKIMYQRDYDALTKLCTNGLFKRKTDKLLQEGSKAFGTAAMLMMDLDDFKQVNDSYGHEWGDTYLKTFAQVLLQLYPTDAVVGRRSGDEFHLFLYGAQTQQEILNRVEKLYDTLGKTTLTRPDQSLVNISISAGVVWCEEGMTCEELLSRADEKLYLAKKISKGRYIADGQE
ncbi:MAG: diguanylate cyclase [Oscillospiraceae bacterium]